MEPQAVIVLSSAIVAIAFAGMGIHTEWTRLGVKAANAVSFMWAGVAYFVGLSALVSGLGTGDANRLSVSVNALALGAVLAGIAGMALGSRSALTERVVKVLPQAHDDLSKSGWYVAALGLLGLAIAVRYAAYGNDFLFGALTTNLPRSWSNYVRDFSHAALPAGLILVHITLAYRTTRMERVAILLLLGIVLLYSLLQFSRRPMVFLVVGSAVYWLHTRTARSAFGWKAIALGLGGGVLFAAVLFSAVFRWLTLQTGLSVDVRLIGDVLSLLSTTAASLDAYPVHTACVSWFQEPDRWLLGESFLQVITNPIPRAMWPGKPESFGFTIARLMSVHTTNYGPTIFGEGFANFGLLGSFIFGWLLGWCARVAQGYQEGAQTAFAKVLSAMVAFEFFSQVRGDLQGMTTPMLERIGLLAGSVLGTGWLMRRLGWRMQPEDLTSDQDAEDEDAS